MMLSTCSVSTDTACCARAGANAARPRPTRRTIVELFIPPRCLTSSILAIARAGERLRPLEPRGRGGAHSPSVPAETSHVYGEFVAARHHCGNRVIGVRAGIIREHGESIRVRRTELR